MGVTGLLLPQSDIPAEVGVEEKEAVYLVQTSRLKQKTGKN